MSPIARIEIELNEMKSKHTLYSNENNKDLVVVFPGGNNSVDRPILHYLRSYFSDQQYDILCISYENIVKREDTLQEKTDKLVIAVNTAIEEISKDKIYDKKIFISRSFGNVISCDLKIKYSIPLFKSIYISPTSRAIKSIKEYPGFIITSSNDEYLTKEERDELSLSTNKNVLIFKDGNHSLETTNIFETIEFHKLAVEKVISYFKE